MDEKERIQLCDEIGSDIIRRCKTFEEMIKVATTVVASICTISVLSGVSGEEKQEILKCLREEVIAMIVGIKVMIERGVAEGNEH